MKTILGNPIGTLFEKLRITLEANHHPLIDLMRSIMY